MLTNTGSIGALSDRAVFGDPLITDNGTMTGFVKLTGINQYINNGAFNLRHFADTNETESATPCALRYRTLAVPAASSPTMGLWPYWGRRGPPRWTAPVNSCLTETG
jgi:hypothetical protein